MGIDEDVRATLAVTLAVSVGIAVSVDASVELTSVGVMVPEFEELLQPSDNA